MTEHIAQRYTVALLGFSESERSATSPVFRLADEPAPVYVETTHAHDADFLITNGDHAASVATVREHKRLLDTVFIGATAPAGAVACVSSPASSMQILRALDLLLAQRLAKKRHEASADWAGTAPGLLDAAGGQQQKDVLVVDNSRVALRFLQVRLHQRGYRVHTAVTPEEALERLAAQSFSMVFLDVALGPDASMDGLTLCQCIKQGRVHTGDAVPQVVLVTGLSTSSDRVRGALAGCDAYLTKPVMEDDFTQVLRLLDPSLAA